MPYLCNSIQISRLNPTYVTNKREKKYKWFSWFIPIAFNYYDLFGLFRKSSKVFLGQDALSNIFLALFVSPSLQKSWKEKHFTLRLKHTVYGKSVCKLHVGFQFFYNASCWTFSEIVLQFLPCRSVSLRFKECKRKGFAVCGSINCMSSR